MIGDPPNIIVGNALKEYIDFNDFLRVMAPGVVITVRSSYCSSDGTTGKISTRKSWSWI